MIESVKRFCAAAYHGYQWLTRLGLPPRFQIVQFPNLPLIIAIAAGQLARHSHGTAHGYALAVAFLAMGLWSYLEITAGSNWARRLIGVFFGVMVLLHLGHALG